MINTVHLFGVINCMVVLLLLSCGYCELYYECIYILTSSDGRVVKSEVSDLTCSYFF